MSSVDFHRLDFLRMQVVEAIEAAFAAGYDFIATPVVCVRAVPNAGPETVGPSSVNGVATDPLIGWTMTYPINFGDHDPGCVVRGNTDIDAARRQTLGRCRLGRRRGRGGTARPLGELVSPGLTPWSFMAWP